MKKRRSVRFHTKNFYYLSLFLFTVSLGSGCKKSSQPNPCDGLINEGMPTQVGLIFIDGQTGENILLSKNIDTAAITITPAPMDLHLKRGVIVKNAGSPLYGSLVFSIADLKEGMFNYKIDITNVGSATLSYTNKEEKTNNNCNPTYISITNPTIEDHPFTILRTAFRLVFKITL